MTRYQLEQLYIKIGAELQYYLFRKTGDIDIASDLMQESFLKVLEQGEQKVIFNHKSYLYQVANNLVTDYIRKKMRKNVFSVPCDELVEIIDTLIVVKDNSQQLEMKKLFRKAIEQLPSLTQQIFILQKIKGLTYTEVAEYLAISDSSVQKHLLKASKFITSYLNRTL